MVYIHRNRMVPIVPDLDDLPTTIRLPHARRMPFAALVVSAIWMMSSAFSPVWMPILWPEMSLTTQVISTFVLTVAALGGGTIALRRYASEDEVTIAHEGVDLRNFTWFGIERKSFDWSKLSKIEQSSAESGHQILELVPNDSSEKKIPVFVARDEHQATRVKERLEGFLGDGTRLTKTG
jgi:hypothetical protein